MSLLKKNKKKKGGKPPVLSGKVKPWMGDGIARIRSLGKPMSSRASKGNR